LFTIYIYNLENANLNKTVRKNTGSNFFKNITISRLLTPTSDLASPKYRHSHEKNFFDPIFYNNIPSERYERDNPSQTIQTVTNEDNKKMKFVSNRNLISSNIIKMVKENRERAIKSPTTYVNLGSQPIPNIYSPSSVTSGNQKKRHKKNKSQSNVVHIDLSSFVNTKK